MKNMKILLLSTGGKIGGEETFTRNLAINLQKHAHYVEVACGGNVQRVDLESYNIKICPVNIESRTPYGLYKAARELTKYILDNKFEIVHAQAVGPAIMGVMAKKFHKCKTPWIWHNHGITEFAYNHIVKHLNSLDCIVANSDYVKESLKGHGVKSDKIVRIHNGIDFDGFYLDKEQKIELQKKVKDLIKCAVNDRLFIYVGRLSPEKGVDVFLEGFEKVYGVHRNVQCVIVGDGIERDKLIKQKSEYRSYANIHFLGFRSDIRDLIGGCDALILPSHIETFSLTTLQSFASGTPVIGSDVGGTPEQILDKFSGRLFQNRNTEELKDCMIEIIDYPDKANYYAKNAQELSRNYLNSNRMTEEILSVYEKLIGSKK